MVNKGKLKMALAAEQGVDFQKLHQKRAAKLASQKHPKKPTVNGGGKSVKDDGDHGLKSADADDDDESDDEEVVGQSIPLNDESSSESEVEMEEKLARKPKTILKFTKPATTKAAKPTAVENDDEDDEEEDEEDIPMSDLEDLPEDEKDDLIPHTRLTINNTTALLASLNRISIPTDKSVAFTTHQVVIGTEPTAGGIEDIQDDLTRELAFYKQSLDAAKKARALLKGEGVPFSRPKDYFAEMVKDDGHMEKVKAKLVEEASAKKASSEARKQRDLKKFGKQVQNAKVQERAKDKRDTLEKIKSLKRKRQDGGDDVGAREADLFDVGVETELKKHRGPEKSFSRNGRDGGPNAKRMGKNEKYGNGGKKKHSKSGDAASSADLSGFSAKNMKGGSFGGAGGKGKAAKPRLGKARRNAGAQKR